jgi:hypothetical protein
MPCSHRLQLSNTPSGSPAELPINRPLLYASGLLWFHFKYGDFVRWLGGEYPNCSRNWDETSKALLTARQRQPPQNFPPADYPRGKCMFSEGVPLLGHPVSPSAELPARDQYNNHLAVKENYAAVEQKFAREEEKSFHIHLPRFMLYFMVGIMLNPLQWAWQRGKGRICVDCTDGPDGPDTAGSTKTHIPKPSQENADKCPPVLYMTAFQRFLINIRCLHITYPQQDILLHANDIDAAFRRIIYAPDMASIFAYVFGPYVIVPVGMVFGARSALMFFSVASDIWADIATTGDLHLSKPLHLLTANITLPELPDPQDLTPAIPYAQNMPQSLVEQEISTTTVSLIIIAFVRFRNPSFQHYNRAFYLHSCCSDGQLKIAAGSCIAPDKWDPLVSFIVLFLGYLRNSRTLMVM